MSFGGTRIRELDSTKHVPGPSITKKGGVGSLRKAILMVLY